jgi:hypothetical protein
MPEQVSVTGLREFQRQLRDMDAALPKRIRLVMNEAAQVVIEYARPRIPRRTGRAAGSIKARSTQRTAGVAIGGRRAGYYPWLDFGGQGKRKGRPPARPFIKEGRYLYPALRVKRDELTEIMSSGLAGLAKDAGLEVSGDG